MGISNPQSETWSGTLGSPQLPEKSRRTAEAAERPLDGIISPVRAQVSQLQSNCCQLNRNPKCSSEASRTRIPSGTTSFSLPIPSPGMTAILKVPMKVIEREAMFVCSIELRMNPCRPAPTRSQLKFEFCALGYLALHLSVVAAVPVRVHPVLVGFHGKVAIG